MAEQVEKKTPEKAKPANKKGGFLKKASRFFKDLKSEVKKVVWPTRKQVFKNTVAVLAAMGAVGVVIWILDALLTLLRGLLLGA